MLLPSEVILGDYQIVIVCVFLLDDFIFAEARSLVGVDDLKWFILH